MDSWDTLATCSREPATRWSTRRSTRPVVSSSHRKCSATTRGSQTVRTSKDSAQLPDFLSRTWTMRTREWQVLGSRTRKLTPMSTATTPQRSSEPTKSQSRHSMSRARPSSHLLSLVSQLLRLKWWVKILLTIGILREVLHQIRCRKFNWASTRTMKLVACHIKVTIATEWREKTPSKIKNTSSPILTEIASLMVSSSTSRDRQLLRTRLAGLRTTDQMNSYPKTVSRRNFLLESRSTLDRKSKTDLVSTTMIVFTFCQVGTSSTLKDSTSTRKATTSSVATMTRWLESTSQAPNTLTWRCKRTRVIMLVTTATQTRRTDSARLTTACMTTLSLDATSEASMLIRTIQASPAASNTLTSSPKRAECTDQSKTKVVSTTTLSKTSSEGTLQTGLMWSTHRQKIRKAMLNMIKCRLAPRTRSTDLATSSLTESLSSRPLLTTSLLNLVLNLPRIRTRKAPPTPRKVPRTRFKRNKKKCWWQSCEMGDRGIQNTIDWS